MRQYNVFQAMVLSFGSKSLYRDVGRGWRGACLLYLLLLLGMSWLAAGIRLQAGLNAFVSRKAPRIAAQIPEIRVQGGRVSVDRPEPHVIADPDTARPLVVIDTTGRIDSLEQTQAFALLKESSLLVRHGGSDVRTYDLSRIDGLSVDGDRFLAVLQWARRWFTVLFCPVALLVSYSYRVVQALVYGLIGMIFAKILRVRLGYGALVRLAVMAVTPVIIVDTILLLIGASIPYWRLLAFIAAMAYLLYGIKASVEGGTPETPPYTIEVRDA